MYFIGQSGSLYITYYIIPVDMTFVVSDVLPQEYTIITIMLLVIPNFCMFG